MTMAATESSLTAAQRVRWTWLWGAKRDFALSLVPFWMGLALVAALYFTRNSGATPEAMWSIGGVSAITVAFFIFGPIVDGPHLWATIARTYTDAEEWAQRRHLFISSLLAFAMGPTLILAPYVANMFVPVPQHLLGAGWTLWSAFFFYYALYHINKQHWGFISLYKRKNNDNDVLENRVDAVFYNVAFGVLYVAIMNAPWGGTWAKGVIAEARPYIYAACRDVFLFACAAYVIFQAVQWSRGVVRNGPKLLYIASVVPVTWLALAFDARIAAFWTLIIGVGHCSQYHGVVWNYGQKRYAVTEETEAKLPHRIFGNVWLYAVLGVAFALVTLQGPHADAVKAVGSDLLQTSVFSHIFAFLNPKEGHVLGIQLLTAFISGVRLHHFYVDSKIWRVSKNAGLAANLNVKG